MPAAPIPPDESERVKTVRALGLLDAPPDERFDSLTRQAQRAFGVPVALITLVDEDRERFVSGAGTRIRDVPREQSFGAYAILGDAPLVVSDAARDPRFSDNPLVHEGLKARFYAGIPLTAADGRAVGAFCVIDRIPRQLNETQMRTLFELARHAERELAAFGARAPRFLERPARGQVSVARIVRAGLIGDEIGPDAAPHEFGKDLRGVAE